MTDQPKRAPGRPAESQPYPDYISMTWLEQFLGVRNATIYRAFKDGSLEEHSEGGGTYRFKDQVQAWIQRTQKLKKNTVNETDLLRARKLMLECQLLEEKLASEQGKTIPIEVYEEVIGNDLATVRSQMLALPYALQVEFGWDEETTTRVLDIVKLRLRNLSKEGEDDSWLGEDESIRSPEHDVEPIEGGVTALSPQACDGGPEATAGDDEQRMGELALRAIERRFDGNR